MKHTTEPIRQVTIRLPDSLHAWLTGRCERENVSMNQVLIDMVKRAKAKELKHVTK